MPTNRQLISRHRKLKTWTSSRRIIGSPRSWHSASEGKRKTSPLPPLRKQRGELVGDVLVKSPGESRMCSALTLWSLSPWERGLTFGLFRGSKGQENRSGRRNR